MPKIHRFLVSLLVGSSLLLAGCSTPDSTTVDRVATGAAVGAASGGVIGLFTGHVIRRAVIGAAAGAAGGAVYDQIQKSKHR